MAKNRLDLADSRVLITGGAGLIGSALLWALNRRGCEQVVVSDRLGKSEKWRNLTSLQFENYVESDELLPALEMGELGDFDLVLHMGACSSTTEPDASYLIRNNFQFTKEIATWALQTDARFVYASSAATYGSDEESMSDLDFSVAGQAHLRPLNMYGYSKLLFDRWAARQGLFDRIVGLKFFNIFGPNEAHKGDMKSLVAKAVPQIQETGKLRLFRSYHPDYADGESMRDFLYVKDATEMTLFLAENRSASGIFNVGSGKASTWLELGQALFDALDLPPQIEFIDMPEQLRGKYQYFTEANIDRLRQAGYDQPVTPLGEAIADYVRNYLLHDRRLEP